MTAMARQVVEGYLADLGGHWLAHDVVVAEGTTGEVGYGRGAARRLLAPWVQGTAPARLIVSGHCVAVEWTAMAALVDVVGGEIVRMRLFRGRPAATGNSAGTVDP